MSANPYRWKDQPVLTVGSQDNVGLEDSVGLKDNVGLKDSVGLQDNVEPGTSKVFDALASNVLPESSRDCALQKGRLQAANRKDLKGNILQTIKASEIEEPRKKAIYNAVATVLKVARQSRRRSLTAKKRIGKIEHLVQTSVCQVLDSLPTPLHALLLVQMRHAGKTKSARRFSEEEKINDSIIHTIQVMERPDEVDMKGASTSADARWTQISNNMSTCYCLFASRHGGNASDEETDELLEGVNDDCFLCDQPMEPSKSCNVKERGIKNLIQTSIK